MTVVAPLVADRGSMGVWLDGRVHAPGGDSLYEVTAVRETERAA